MAEPDEPEGGNSVPEWVVTYGDMMSLLLTFFIMLVSLSEVSKDTGKMRAMMDAIREAFGPTSGRSGALGHSLQTTSVLNKRNSRGVRSEGGTAKASRNSKGPSGAHKTVKRVNHGTVVTLGGATLFGRFDAELTEPLKRNLDVIAEVVAKKPHRLMVRGHASPEPLPAERSLEIGGLRVRNQMDLSFARARGVANYLVSKGIDPRRLQVSAAGETEPRQLTRDEAKRNQNRRVDVFLIDSYITHRQDVDSPRR